MASAEADAREDNKQETPPPSGDDSEAHPYDLVYCPLGEVETDELKSPDLDIKKCMIFDEVNAPEHERKKRQNPEPITQEDLINIKMMGQGHFGMTFKANWREGEIVVKASKRGISKDDYEELGTMLKLPYSPNVLSIIGVCRNFVHKGIAEATLAIILPFQENGDLKNFIKKNGPLIHDEYINIVLGMARGLSHLHDNDVVHRDLALRNYLVSLSGRVLISDFGLSRGLESNSDDAYYKISGGEVPWRTAPLEVLKVQKYTKKSDIWALGITIWELFHPKMQPFPEIDEIWKLLQLLRTSKFAFSLDYGDKKEETYPPALETAVKWCCETDPLKRPEIHLVIKLLTSQDLKSAGIMIPVTSKHMQNALREKCDLEYRLQLHIDERDFLEAQKIQDALSKHQGVMKELLEREIANEPESVQQAKRTQYDLQTRLDECIEQRKFQQAHKVQEMLYTQEEAMLNTPSFAASDWRIRYRDLDFGEQIGVGVHARVYAGKWKAKPVALKTIVIQLESKSNTFEDLMATKKWREFDVWYKTNSPYIVKLYGAAVRCLSAQAGQWEITFVMERCEAELFDHLESFQLISFDSREKYAYELALGMKYLHDMNILHRDLRLMNVAILNDVVKIIDFGSSRIDDEIDVTLNCIGAPSHMAPEIWNKRAATKKSDIFSYGMCLYNIFAGHPPWDGMDMFELYTALITKDKRPKWPKDKTPPRWIIELVNDCWKTKPDKRPSVSEICDIFSHNTSHGGDNQFASHKLKIAKLGDSAFTIDDLVIGFNGLEVVNVKNIKHRNLVGAFLTEIECSTTKYLGLSSRSIKVTKQSELRNLLIDFTKKKSDFRAVEMRFSLLDEKRVEHEKQKGTEAIHLTEPGTGSSN